MNPETAAVNLIATIITKLGPTPILLFLAVMGMGPWAAMIWLSYKQDKRLTKVFERQDKRFEEVVDMYKSNVDLVQNYENVSESYRGITNNLQDLVILSTGTMERLVGQINNNLYCPLVRQKTKPGRIEEEETRI